MASLTSQALVGREQELSTIDGLLEAIDDRGGSLLIRGEAGLGKSALLDEAEARAAGRGIAVLRTAGAPSETQLAFSGLQTLLRPRLEGIDALPAPQARALRVAFGLGDGPVPDLFLIALAALGLLADAAADSPLLLVVEDAHWLDADTSEVLSFVARRVEMEPIAVLLAVRDGYQNPLDEAQLPEIRVRPLGAADSASLLDGHAPGLGRHLRRRVLEAAAGNPLALRELPRAAAIESDGGAWSLAPLPITDALERAFSDRASALPATTRTALLVAALDGEGSLDELLEAASSLAGYAITANEFGAAESAGLVELGATGVRFLHPLVRAAIERRAPAPIKRAAHAALAEAHGDDPDRRVWHRAAACAGPNSEVVEELQATAARALARGAPALAAAALERGAELTADTGVRGDLLLRAAEMEFELGRADLALHLLEQAKPLELGEHQRAALTLLFEAADADSWSGPGRVASVAATAVRMASLDDPERVLRSFLPVARSCWWGNAEQHTRDLVIDAVEGLEVPADHPALLLILACTDPVARGRQVIDRISRMAPDARSDPTAMHLIGTAATAACGFDISLPFLNAAVDGLRAQRRLGQLAQALVSQSYAALHLAKATLADSAADEAARLARESGQPRWAVAAELVQATLEGERGDFERAEELCARAEAELLPVGAQAMLALVQFARGRAAVAHQNYAEGLDHLRRTLDPRDVAYHRFTGAWGLPDMIEAAVHLGELDEAKAWLAELESLAAATGGPYLRAGLAYARPLLAGDDEAGDLYHAALGSDLSSWPRFRARLLLAYGRWLRRQRRVAESRAPLRAARESADALGFDGLAAIARQELRASGESSRQRAPDARDQLTPQELQIARLVADGLSNREIGDRLYLSHRTVGSHLYRMFPKLGVTSRAQVAEALAGISLR
ncbi:MAG TPA: AAA family ATPase [Thermoleophilaceae bacterium]|nr:AAA family ATPase [Thermoleophilaceae bacterium]